MKKLFILLMLATISLIGFAQDKSKTLNLNEYVYDYTLTAGDTISDHDTLWSAELVTNKIAPLLYDIKIKLTKVAGTPKATVTLQGKIFSDDAWTNITAIKYGATSTDTTWTYSGHTAVYWRYLRVINDEVSTKAGKYKVSILKVKLWNQ